MAEHAQTSDLGDGAHAPPGTQIDARDVFDGQDRVACGRRRCQIPPTGRSPGEYQKRQEFTLPRVAERAVLAGSSLPCRSSGASRARSVRPGERPRRRPGRRSRDRLGWSLRERSSPRTRSWDDARSRSHRDEVQQTVASTPAPSGSSARRQRPDSGSGSVPRGPRGNAMLPTSTTGHGAAAGNRRLPCTWR